MKRQNCVIDVHTHAFPDHLAGRAMAALEEGASVKAILDGTIAALLTSMDEAGIEISVLSSIATKPKQFDAILSWSEQIRSERLIVFPSIHPAHPEWGDQIRRIKAAGYGGLKLHPYYQEFEIDDEQRLFPIYELVRELDLVLLMHTGFDIAFPRTRIADPVRTARVIDAFPGLKLIASHLGAWEDWDEVERRLVGRDVYIDVSYSFEYIGTEQARRIIAAHPRERMLFGTDSPWGDQDFVVQSIRGLRLDAEHERMILRDNAARLLGL